VSQELGGAIGAAAKSASPSVGAVAAVEFGVVPVNLQTTVLVLTGILVVIQITYYLWKWNNDRTDRRNR
jgi:hypothetical protein